MPESTGITVDDIIQQIPGSKGVVKVIADKLGCSSNFVRDSINAHPVLLYAITQEKEDTFDQIEEKLMQEAISGKPWAVKYYLDSKGQKRGYGGASFKAAPKGFTLNVVYEVPPQIPDQTDETLQIEGVVVGTGSDDQPEETPQETGRISSE